MKKEYGNYIKADIYSVAVSILYMFNPKIKGKKSKNKTLEEMIKIDCPNIYEILK